MGLFEITAGKVHSPPRRSAGQCAESRQPTAPCIKEIVTLRQTLKTAFAIRWLDHLPDLSEPYRSSPKVSHRAWFSLDEYKRLYEATRKRAHGPKDNRFKWESEQLHDCVLRGKRGVGYCKSMNGAVRPQGVHLERHRRGHHQKDRSRAGQDGADQTRIHPAQGGNKALVCKVI
jgi:hypothetical protein